MSSFISRPLTGVILTVATLAGCGGGVPAAVDSRAAALPATTDQSATASSNALRAVNSRAATDPAADDIVVIAVIDSGLNPYHHDFLAAHMPQHLDNDPGNDLPLDQDPSTWLPGYPASSAFARHTRMDLTLTPDDPNANSDALQAEDAAQWSKVVGSTGTDNKSVAMHWFPGTKIIGHVVFGGANSYAAASHGVGSASVSTGNIYGSCPNCLLVMVHGLGEQANEWVAQQDWIDLQTNSWGYSLTPVVRDRAYAGSDTELQRMAVERGQSIFFSAGNGLNNAFATPNTTLQSSQEGPDWIVTVGAITPTDNSSYSGHGKPADIASIGSGYPSARGNGSVTGQGNFSGTSNATPVIAGLYGAALSRLRALMPGPSRLQNGGVIASGPAACGTANTDCAMADGQLTVHELRSALYAAAELTGAGTSVAGVATIPQSQNVAELEFLSEGHGSFVGRLDGDETYNADLDRIVGIVMGDVATELDPDARDWYIALSHCRQEVWGSWNFGETELGALPLPSPLWPVRSFLSEACPSVIGALVEAERLR